MTSKKIDASAPGMVTPAKGKSGPVTVLGWRDTDKKGAKPTYFLDIRMVGWPAHEMIGLSPSRIKALAEALLQLHDQLPKPSPRKRSA